MPGERLDFIVSANQKIDNYWIRVKGNADCSLTSVFQTAILKYVNSSNKLPKHKVDYENADSSDLKGFVFNPFNQKINEKNKNTFLGIDDVRSSDLDTFSSSYSKKISGKVDKKLYLALDMNLVKNTAVYDDSTWNDLEHDKKPWTSPQINNISFKLPNTPLIYQNSKLSDKIFCNQDNKQQAGCSKNESEFCSCIHMIELNLNDIVEVIVVDGGSQGENHPSKFRLIY